MDDGKLGPEMFFQKFLQVLGKINVSDDEIGFQSDERRGGESGIQNTVLDAANSGKRQRAHDYCHKLEIVFRLPTHLVDFLGRSCDISYHDTWANW